jgi:hypothetical protein
MQTDEQRGEHWDGWNLVDKELYDAIGKLLREHGESEKRISELKDVLGVYADPENWDKAHRHALSRLEFELPEGGDVRTHGWELAKAVLDKNGDGQDKA